MDGAEWQSNAADPFQQRVPFQQTWEAGLMRLMRRRGRDADRRRGFWRWHLAVVVLVVIGWVVPATGVRASDEASTSDVHPAASGTRPAAPSDTGDLITVQATTSASFNQSSDLAPHQGGSNDATLDLTVTAIVNETYEEVPATSENGGVKLLSWNPSVNVTGDLDSTCTPSPDRSKPSPCDIGYFGPGYRNFTCSATAVDLSRFPSPVTDPLHADFPLFAGLQEHPYEAVAVVGGSVQPYTSLVQWNGGPDCTRQDNNEDGGKLLDESSLGTTPFGCTRSDFEVEDTRPGTKSYPACSNNATVRVTNDGLGDSGTKSNDWKMSLNITACTGGGGCCTTPSITAAPMANALITRGSTSRAPERSQSPGSCDLVIRAVKVANPTVSSGMSLNDKTTTVAVGSLVYLEASSGNKKTPSKLHWSFPAPPNAVSVFDVAQPGPMQSFNASTRTHAVSDYDDVPGLTALLPKFLTTGSLQQRYLQLHFVRTGEVTVQLEGTLPTCSVCAPATTTFNVVAPTVNVNVLEPDPGHEHVGVIRETTRPGHPGGDYLRLTGALENDTVPPSLQYRYSTTPPQGLPTSYTDGRIFVTQLISLEGTLNINPANHTGTGLPVNTGRAHLIDNCTWYNNFSQPTGKVYEASDTPEMRIVPRNGVVSLRVSLWTYLMYQPTTESSIPVALRVMVLTFSGTARFPDRAWQVSDPSVEWNSDSKPVAAVPVSVGVFSQQGTATCH